MECRSLRGNVDRNDKNYQSEIIAFSRSLRGNVDRNSCETMNVRARIVVPYVGTWIEIRMM